MNEIFGLYKELLKRTPPLTAEEIEATMIETCGYTWQEIKLAQEYCTPPEKKNYWVDDKPKMSAEWPDCEPKQEWSAQDWDAVRPDMVNSPPHYTAGGIETIDFIKAKLSDEGYRGYLQGNLLKYASRIGKKGSDDAGKAAWYAKRLDAL
jgi:hypothetical protein